MIKCEDKVILFGLSNVECMPAEHYLEEYDKDHKVQMIIDNNPNFAGEFHGIPVRPQSVLTDYVNDETVTVIITARYRWEEIQNILLEMGFSENRIITAMKDRDFFLSYSSYFYKTTYGSKPLQPGQIRIELCTGCNCRCIYCPHYGVEGTHPERGFMSWETLKTITKQIGKIPSLTTAYFIGRGETYLHPEWYEMIEYMLSNSYVEDLLIYTNGMPLNQDTARKLAKLPFRSLVQEVSIDGETPEENNLYRIGSDYETIRRNIYDAAEILSGRNVRFALMNTCPVTLDYLERHNYTLPFSGRPVPEFLQRDFPPEMRKVSHLAFLHSGNRRVEANGVSLFPHWAKDAQVITPCQRPFYQVNITFSGDLYDCTCNSEYINKIFGNAATDGLLKSWRESALMNDIRQRLMDGTIPDICRHCSRCLSAERPLAVKSE